MNVTSTLLAQALRFTSIRPPLYKPDLVRRIQAQYGFVGAPTTAQELLPLDPTEPLVFTHGKLSLGDRTIVVDKLSVFAQALSVASASTEDADLFLEDILQWSPTSVGRVFAEISPRKIYISQLEVMLDAALERCFPMAVQFGQTLSALFKAYGYEQEVPRFQVYSLGMTPDPALLRLACEFRIERRVGVPYESNVYFAQAPLRTADHIVILEQFEQILSTLSASSIASALLSAQPPAAS